MTDSIRKPHRIAGLLTSYLYMFRFHIGQSVKDFSGIETLVEINAGSIKQVHEARRFYSKIGKGTLHIPLS
ncbi:MAG: hypothetical protein PHW35_12010 [Lentimicrobiaceae bacterium]|nr:hypothetical protein [Lentimicrobiaceae bacterium]MDD4598682.1 hypothetical protein [Lentimicrobiaceae bacterium]MDY0027079.1 hypothetical protein [Lentimicrobium sp.]